MSDKELFANTKPKREHKYGIPNGMVGLVVKRVEVWGEKTQLLVQYPEGTTCWEFEPMQKAKT